MDNKYKNCTKEPEGYYFNNETEEYKQCYNSCKTCNIEGNYTNHNCKICKEGFNLEIHYEQYKNCYKQCDFYFYYDEVNNISYKGNISSFRTIVWTTIITTILEFISIFCIF